MNPPTVSFPSFAPLDFGELSQTTFGLSAKSSTAVLTIYGLSYNPCAGVPSLIDGAGIEEHSATALGALQNATEEFRSKTVWVVRPRQSQVHKTRP
jgi:hypothetical protein